jgi:tetratricopeptide (TPR) repeat protein
MHKVLLFCLALACCNGLLAQQDSKQLYESAKILMRQGEFETATTVLLKAIKQDTLQLDMQKDLAYLYLLQKYYAKATQVARPLIDRADADAQCFQILGMAYKAVGNNAECTTLYKYGILKFPQAGVIYNEFGELLAKQNQLDQAIIQWEKGIEQDPNFSGNYYNACMYYSINRQWIRVAFYGEYFINIESYTARTDAVKIKILNAYQSLLQPNAIASIISSTAFEKTLANAICNISQETKIVNIGIDTILSARTRFLNKWNMEQAAQYPLRLIDHMNQLVKESMFEAYNQWVFGNSINATAYQQWQTANANKAKEYQQFQQGRVFKVPLLQYYFSK